jgi:thiopeptide-type bacteriocin biosynthesis protein
MTKQPTLHPPVQKTFYLGEEWLYYKIYCGVKTADDLLLHVVKPICTQLLEEQCIDKWFFIRYSDPDPHLRLRFHVTSEEHISKIILLMRDHIQTYMEHHQVWDLQLATYQRELERYGANTITHAESLFFYDSEQVLHIIEQSTSDEERFINTFHWVEELLHHFNFPDTEQIAFLERGQDQFKNEFSIQKAGNKQLNIKYKNLESQLFAANALETKYEKQIATTIAQFKRAQETQLLSVSIDYLLASFIHMTINRIFKSQQRLHEMMIYDFLTKKNKSKLARYGKL